MTIYYARGLLQRSSSSPPPPPPLFSLLRFQGGVPKQVLRRKRLQVPAVLFPVDSGRRRWRMTTFTCRLKIQLFLFVYFLPKKIKPTIRVISLWLLAILTYHIIKTLFNEISQAFTIFIFLTVWALSLSLSLSLSPRPSGFWSSDKDEVSCSHSLRYEMQEFLLPFLSSTICVNCLALSLNLTWPAYQHSHYDACCIQVELLRGGGGGGRKGRTYIPSLARCVLMHLSVRGGGGGVDRFTLGVHGGIWPCGGLRGWGTLTDASLHCDLCACPWLIHWTKLRKHTEHSLAQGGAVWPCPLSLGGVLRYINNMIPPWSPPTISRGWGNGSPWACDRWT